MMKTLEFTKFNLYDFHADIKTNTIGLSKNPKLEKIYIIPNTIIGFHEHKYFPDWLMGYKHEQERKLWERLNLTKLICGVYGQAYEFIVNENVIDCKKIIDEFDDYIEIKTNPIINVKLGEVE